MSKAGDFIQKYNLDYRSINISEQMPIYIEEMQAGLNGLESSLLMIPTYLRLKDELLPNRKIICVDAGGTNLRITTAHFDDNNAFIMEDIARYIMPGVEKELEAHEFFDALAAYIAPFCTKTKDIVMSFAYRTNVTSDIDAEIIMITKEVKVKGDSGKLIAKEIKASLAKLGILDINMIIINDTVASALSGRADYSNQGYGAFTGTILGTGSNSCYPEKISSIGKLTGFDGNGIMIINTEAGSYNKMPRSVLDKAYDAGTIHPGIGTAEKMSSGAYLGALCEFVLKRAAEENVFHTRGVEDIARLGAADISEYLSDGSGVVEEYMMCEEDEANAKELLNNMVLRAARLAALQMAAMAKKSCRSNNRLCMSVEGTTYEKMPGLKEELHRCLEECLSANNIQADIVTIKHAVLKGCAIAGLSM